jgi:hypothetical protein
MTRILAACALVVAVGIMLALLRPQPVLSDVTLTSLVNEAYGARTEDASLHQLAHERAQYQVTYSGGVCGPEALTHTGLVTAEVLACNYLGPARAVEQWQGSPTHDELLSGDFNLIGCGSAQGIDGAWFYACTLSSASVAQPTPAPIVPAPPAEPTNPPASDQPVLLPDTATEGP